MDIKKACKTEGCLLWMTVSHKGGYKKDCKRWGWLLKRIVRDNGGYEEGL